jgi:hypothetical protein
MVAESPLASLELPLPLVPDVVLSIGVAAFAVAACPAVR